MTAPLFSHSLPLTGSLPPQLRGTFVVPRGDEMACRPPGHPLRWLRAPLAFRFAGGGVAQISADGFAPASRSGWYEPGESQLWVRDPVTGEGFQWRDAVRGGRPAVEIVARDGGHERLFATLEPDAPVRPLDLGLTRQHVLLLAAPAPEDGGAPGRERSLVYQVDRATGACHVRRMPPGRAPHLGPAWDTAGATVVVLPVTTREGAASVPRAHRVHLGALQRVVSLGVPPVCHPSFRQAGTGTFFAMRYDQTQVVAKVNPHTARWTGHDFGDARRAGEPVFVPDAQGRRADQGWVLSLVCDLAVERTFVSVLDAHAMQEIARAYVAEGHVSWDGYLHGRTIRSSA